MDNNEKLYGAMSVLLNKLDTLNKINTNIFPNDNTSIKIIQVNNKYINLDTLQKQKQDYKNLIEAGFVHSVWLWDYLGLTKDEYKAIKYFLHS